MPDRKALILSPFATFPPDAGQRKRAAQTTRLVKNLGFRVTFFLYAFEDGWKAAANEAWLEQMRGEWDEVIVHRAHPKVGMPPVNGTTHGIDEWWDEALETHLKHIFDYRHFDLFVVHNVWLSKAFDFAPRGTVRVLDAHDVFSSRRECFERAKVAEFFIADEASEAHGAGRADIVLAIQEADEEWFRRRTAAAALSLPYDPGAPPAPARTDYLHPDKVVFGFLGSAHIFNVMGVSAYCAELNAIVGRTASPVEFRIGGAVCDAVGTRGPWTLCGKVADEDAFLSQVDAVVVPVFDGSGFKVKVADAAARGIPVLASEHAAIGMTFDRRVLARTPRDLAQMTADIALARPPYRELAATAERAHQDLRRRVARGALKLERKIRGQRRAVAYDLTGLSDIEARTVLLSWSGAFHLMRFLAKQYVILSPPLRDTLRDLVPAGVYFIGEDEIAARHREIARWITVRDQGPRSWGAASGDIVVDETWRRPIDDRPETTPEPCGAQFWHNIAWDELVKKLVNGAAVPPPGSPVPPASIYVASAEHRRRLDGRLTRLLPDHALGSVETFDDFARLLWRAASGRLRRVVIADTARPDRIEMLRQICGIRGIAFVGPAGGGALSLGEIPEWVVHRTYESFEKNWRAGLAARAA